MRFAANRRGTVKTRLTEEQKHGALSILSQVNKSEVCRKARVNVSTIDNVLRGTSSRVDLLNKVLKAANKQIENRAKAVEELNELIPCN